MSRRYSMIAAAWLLLGGTGCVHRTSARKPVMMVPVPPPETPHAESSVPAGGAISFEADQVVSCEASVPDLVRAYASPTALVVLGDKPGRTWIRLRLASGDEFLLDMKVTNDSPAYGAIAIGEQMTLPLDGTKEYQQTGECVRLQPSADATRLFVVGESPCSSVITFTMLDGSTKFVEIVVVGGQRLL